MSTEDEQSMQALIKLTLLSSHPNLTLAIPYNKNYIPQVKLQEGHTIYCPINATLFLHSPEEQADVDLNPLFNHLNSAHLMNIQMYKKPQLAMKGQIIEVAIEFAYYVIKKSEPIHLDVKLKRAILLKSPHLLGKLSPHIQLVSNGGFHWKSKVAQDMHLAPVFDQVAHITTHSFLDKLTVFLYHQGEKLGQCAIFLLQLLGDKQTKVLDLKKNGQIVGSLKISFKNRVPDTIS